MCVCTFVGSSVLLKIHMCAHLHAHTRGHARAYTRTHTYAYAHTRMCTHRAAAFSTAASLIAAGADVDIKDNQGFTAVERASAAGRTEFVRLLSRQGLSASLNPLNTTFTGVYPRGTHWRDIGETYDIIKSKQKQTKEPPPPPQRTIGFGRSGVTVKLGDLDSLMKGSAVF